MNHTTLSNNLKWYRCCCLLWLCCTFWMIAGAQNQGNVSRSHDGDSLNKAFIISGLHQGVQVLSQPFRWEQRDWVRFSAIIGGTGTLMVFDKKIRAMALRHQNQLSSGISTAVEPLGDIYGLFVFPAVYTAGLITDNQRIRSLGLKGSQAMALSAVLTLVSKNIIRRQRPDAGDNPFNYALPFSQSKYNSTPSAHAAIAFTLATALAEEFSEAKWVAPVAYSVASLTALSRIYHNRHWASDVLLGAALGHFVTLAVYRLGQKKHRMLPTFR